MPTGTPGTKGPKNPKDFFAKLRASNASRSEKARLLREYTAKQKTKKK